MRPRPPLRVFRGPGQPQGTTEGLVFDMYLNNSTYSCFFLEPLVLRLAIKYPLWYFPLVYQPPFHIVSRLSTPLISTIVVLLEALPSALYNKLRPSAPALETADG